MSVAIEFVNVTKYYRKGPRFLPSLRDWSNFLLRKQMRLLGDKFAALKRISFTIENGEVVGFVGPNGAGKSTILKLISKVTFPSEGQINRHGSIAGLLELGAGFHPELTGAENIIFNGMILGLSRKEIAKRFDEITAFSGIGKFLDTPIKFYSAGMKARLGFSVSAYVRPDILLVDDVLAVGDEEFKRKCYQKMREFCTDKSRAVVFVSHNLRSLRGLCTRVIYLNKGQIKASGDPQRIIDIYLKECAH